MEQIFYNIVKVYNSIQFSWIIVKNAFFLWLFKSHMFYCANNFIEKMPSTPFFIIYFLGHCFIINYKTNNSIPSEYEIKDIIKNYVF